MCCTFFLYAVSDQCFFLFAGELFDLIFPFQCFGFGGAGFPVDQFDRPPAFCIFSPLSFVVHLNAPVQVGGPSGIIGTVVALKNVYELFHGLIVP